jgi:hypothetical protein
MIDLYSLFEQIYQLFSFISFNHQSFHVVGEIKDFSLRIRRIISIFFSFPLVLDCYNKRDFEPYIHRKRK